MTSQREERRLADQEQELLFRYWYDGDIGHRHGGGAARFAVNQRHFPENGIFIQRLKQAVACTDLQLARFE